MTVIAPVVDGGTEASRADATITFVVAEKLYCFRTG
jgi:hypothetical protein